MGRADEPVYLWLKERRLEFREAKSLWGLETYATQDAVRQEDGAGEDREAAQEGAVKVFADRQIENEGTRLVVPGKHAGSEFPQNGAIVHRPFASNANQIPGGGTSDL